MFKKIELNFLERIKFYFSNANIITGGKNSIGTGKKARVIAISVKA
jgi:hypothetical protein